jgi:hypothetical protein
MRNQLSKGLFLGFIVGGLGGGFVSRLLLDLLPLPGSVAWGEHPEAWTILLLGRISFGVGCLGVLVLVYKLWAMLRDASVRRVLSPFVAVILLIIPLVNVGRVIVGENDLLGLSRSLVVFGIARPTRREAPAAFPLLVSEVILPA